MNSQNDQQLLRAYIRHRSEAAFAELVDRHIDFVYSAAFRMLPDSHLAQDVTQLVFVTLAQHAAELATHPFLSGWLHRTARNLAAKAVRAEVSRRAREQDALTMNELPSPEADPLWDHVAPQLDSALGELHEPERDALLLRYFEKKSAREIGEVLGITEQAAQKRVNRAVESLRHIFAQKGIVVGTGGLAALLATNVVQAAPAGLAALACGYATLTGTAVQTTATLALTKGIAMTGIQKLLVVTALTVSISGGLYEARQATRLRDRVASVESHSRLLAAELQRQRDTNAANLATLGTETARLESNHSELVRLRGELARLRAAGQAIPAPQAKPQPAEAAKANNELPKDSWVDAGLMTPEAALKTRGWCVVNGNRERFKESLVITDGARKMLEDMLVRMAEKSNAPGRDQAIQMVLEHKLGIEDALLMPMMAENQQKGYSGYRIVSDKPISADEQLLRVETTLTDGSSKEENLKLGRFNGEWKVIIDEEFVRTR